MENNSQELNQDIENECRVFEISNEDKNEFKRLDQFLAAKIPDFSRTFIKNLFEKGEIQLQHAANPNQKIELKKLPAVGSIIEVHIPPPMPAEAIAENLPLEILYEDEHLVIVNKAQGMVTHPAPGNYTGTLVNAILYHCTDIIGVCYKKRNVIFISLVK
jgi:23S rRNA pseudouridine1911/1915/1917 synthase